MNLTSPAYLLLCAHLEKHGNLLSADHRAALYGLCETLTQYAEGKLAGRKVFALGTGLGKTSAIIAWIAVLHRIGDAGRHVSVAVSASKVEALCSIKRALLDAGVPEESIGLKHSLHDASLPSTGDADRRFMLVTHQRVRGGSNHKLFCEHQGKPRNLLIYDESLFRSDAIAIGARDVRGGLGFLSAVVSGKPDLAGVVDYLTHCRDLIAEAVTAAKDGKALDVRLPELSELERSGYPELIHSATRKPSERSLAEPLVELIELAGNAVRVAVTPQGEGLIWHRVAVPEELKNVLVLDAGYPIRELCKLDPTLSPANRFSDAPIKRYDRVTFHQMFAASGRNSVERSFLHERRENRAVVREVIEVIKRIPPDESALVFTFKSPGDRLKNILLDDLRAAGVGTAAKTADGRDRINVLTWGSETSLNDFSYCRHVILAGILHRNLLDLASVAVGQLDDRKANLDGRWLLELLESELVHCVYQAISRGSCREVDRGQAKPMTAYVIHPRPLQKRLEPVMPGMQHKAWVPVHGGISDGVAVPLALTLLDHLRTLPQDVRKVSTKAAKQALGVAPEQDRAFSRAVALLDTLCGEWSLDRRSLLRNDGAFHGFTPEIDATSL